MHMGIILPMNNKHFGILSTSHPPLVGVAMSGRHFIQLHGIQMSPLDL